MTFEKIREKLLGYGFFVYHNQQKNIIGIYKDSETGTFIWFPADGCIEDIQTSAIGLKQLDEKTAFLLREYIVRYLSTPIQERFDSPRYYLKLNDSFDQEISYLGYYFLDQKYVFDSEYTNIFLQTTFTEEEMRQFPFSADMLIKSGILMKIPVE